MPAEREKQKVPDFDSAVILTSAGRALDRARQTLASERQSDIEMGTHKAGDKIKIQETKPGLAVERLEDDAVKR